MKILITIITVTKNSERFLQETIDSVAQQTYPYIDHLIIDGASTDQTISIIQKNNQRLAYWESNPDNGMYEAINKGLKKSQGDYILVLNSDDALSDVSVIEKMVNEIQKDYLDYYYGNIIKWKNEKLIKSRLFNVNYNQLLFSTHGTFVPHPCFIVSKSLNEKLFGYKTTYKYASDYDYILRALKIGEGRHISVYMTKFRFHENSITSSGKINKERLDILKDHGYEESNKLKRILWFYLLWFYYKILNII